MAEFQKKKIGWFEVSILLCLSMIWGSAFGAIKIAVEDTGPLTVAALRSSLAVAAIGFYFCIRPQQFPHWKNLLNGRLVFVGVTGTLAPFILISWAELHVPSSLAGLLMGSGPLLTVIGGHYITKDEQLNMGRISAVLLGLFGVMLLFAEGFGRVGSSLIWAQLALIVAALCYSSSNLSVKPLSHLPSAVIAGSGFAIASLVALPLAILIEKPVLTQISPHAWLALMWLGFVSTALAFSLRYMLIKRAGAGFTSNVGYLIPVMAVLIGWIVLDEKIETVKLIALALIVVSIILTQRAGVMMKMPKTRATPKP